MKKSTAACKGANIDMMEKLLNEGADPNSGGTCEPMDALLWNLVHVLWSFGEWRTAEKVQRAMDALAWLAKRGGKVRDDSDPLSRLRRAIYDLKGNDKELIKLIICENGLYAVLGSERFEKYTGTPKFQAVLSCLDARPSVSPYQDGRAAYRPSGPKPWAWWRK